MSLFASLPGLEREPGPVGSGQGRPLWRPGPVPCVYPWGRPPSGLECAAAVCGLSILRPRGGPVVR